MKFDKSKYSTKEEAFKFLIENQKLLIAEKKMELKKADAFGYIVHHYNEKEEAIKTEANSSSLADATKIKVKVVINTTKLFDSHEDVHIDGLWKKTLREQKNPYHLQEHKMSFDSVISDKVKAYTETISWKELGFKMEGTTEALMFDSEIDKDRNPFMFNQYSKGWIRNHSVGMRYVQLYLCVNSDEDWAVQEKKNWDKYIDMVANRESVEDNGYFWAVTEAKLVEGSAVLMGSNWATPTQSVEEIKEESQQEPPKGTQKDDRAGSSTQPRESLFSKFANY